MSGYYRRMAAIVSGVVGLLLLASGAAYAFDFDRPLSRGDKGRDVKALHVRIAGWFPNDHQRYFDVDKTFGAKTTKALKRFQAHYGLTADGVAGSATYAVLDRLQDKDGSTQHFDWSEFQQNKSSGCSAKANAYAGTFGGGMVSPSRTKTYVKYLMWRLEAVRTKGGDHPVGINSGFRSVAYNNCIGGASASQHLYGTAADNRMAEVSNTKERRLARHSQVHGIGCYSSLSHNHFDLRLDNDNLASSRAWWWPDKDGRGHELADDGRPCWGESKTKSSGSLQATGALTDPVLVFGALVPSEAEVQTLEDLGEPPDLLGAD